ncbi:MAG: hypothetical protein EB037_10755 [Actinobacteria bacterium]|nr:hypothetical protein [Actinomycetota bacterium]
MRALSAAAGETSDSAPAIFAALPPALPNLSPTSAASSLIALILAAALSAACPVEAIAALACFDAAVSWEVSPVKVTLTLVGAGMVRSS